MYLPSTDHSLSCFKSRYTDLAMRLTETPGNNGKDRNIGTIESQIVCVIKLTTNKLIKAILNSSRASNVCESYTVAINQPKHERTSIGYFSENNNS